MMGIEVRCEVAVVKVGIKGKTDGSQSRWASGIGATAIERVVGIRMRAPPCGGDEGRAGYAAWDLSRSRTRERSTRRSLVWAACSRQREAMRSMSRV